MSAIQKVSYTHDAVIDMIIAQPGISNNELAARFGYTAPWMSMIRSSDAFKARLESRRAELVDPVITASLEDKIRAVTERSVEVLLEKVSQPAALVPDNVALRAAEFGAKAMGLGQKAPPPPVNPQHLEELGQRLLDLQRKCRPMGDVEDVQNARIIEG